MAATYSRPLIYRSLRLHRVTILNLHKQQQLGIFCDVILFAEGVGVPAHQCILSAVSPYFQSHLSTLHSQSEKRVSMELQGIKLKTLKMLLEFIYTSEVVVFREEVMELLNAAKYFQIEELEAVELDGTKLTKVHLGKRINRDCFRAACGSSISAHFLHLPLENTTGLLSSSTKMSCMSHSQFSSLKHDEESVCMGRNSSIEQNTLICRVTSDEKEDNLVEHSSPNTVMEVVVSDQGSVTDLGAVQPASESSFPTRSMSLLLPKSLLPKHSESHVPAAVKPSLPNPQSVCSSPKSSMSHPPEENKYVSISECSKPRHFETHSGVNSSLSASNTLCGESSEGNPHSSSIAHPSANVTLLDCQSKPDKIKKEIVSDKTQAADIGSHSDNREPPKIKISRFCLKSSKGNVISERPNSTEKPVGNRTLARGRRWRTTLRSHCQEETLSALSKSYTNSESSDYITRSISFPVQKILKDNTEIPVCPLINEKNTEESNRYLKKFKVEQGSECDRISLGHLQNVPCEGTVGVLNSTETCSPFQTVEDAKEKKVAEGESFSAETSEEVMHPLCSSAKVLFKEHSTFRAEGPVVKEMAVDESADSSSHSVDKLLEYIKDIDADLQTKYEETNETCQHSSFVNRTEGHTVVKNPSPHSVTADTGKLPHSFVTQEKTCHDSSCMDVWQDDSVADVQNSEASLVTRNVYSMDDSSLESKSVDTIMEEIDELLGVMDNPCGRTSENSLLPSTTGSHINPSDLNQFVTPTLRTSATQTEYERVRVKKLDKKDSSVELSEFSHVYTTITGENSTLPVSSFADKVAVDLCDSLPSSSDHCEDSEPYEGHAKNIANTIPAECFLCNTDLQVHIPFDDDDVIKKSVADVHDQSSVCDTNFQLSPCPEMAPKTGCGSLGVQMILKEAHFSIEGDEPLCLAESAGEEIPPCQVKNKSSADVAHGVHSELQLQEHIESVSQTFEQETDLLIEDETNQSQESSGLCNNACLNVMVFQPGEEKLISSTISSPVGSLQKREGPPGKSVCSTVKIKGKSPRQVPTDAALGSENYLETLSASLDPVPIPKGDQRKLTSYPVIQYFPCKQTNATELCILNHVEVESVKELATTEANFNMETTSRLHMYISLQKEKNEQVPDKNKRILPEFGSTSLADDLNHRALGEHLSFNKASGANAGELKVKCFSPEKANQGIHFFDEFPDTNIYRESAVQTSIKEKKMLSEGITGSEVLRNVTTSLHVSEFMNSSQSLVTSCDLDISCSSIDSSDSNEIDITGGCEAEMEYIPVWPDPSSESDTEIVVVD